MRPTAHLTPRALTRLVLPAGFTAAYPALCFWLPTPDQLPGSELLTPDTHYLPGSELLAPDTRLVTLSSQLVTGAPCTYPAEAPTNVVLTRKLLPCAYPASSSGLQMQHPQLTTSQTKCLDCARGLTRLAHPAPYRTSPGSLFLGLPVGGS
jgi:hypothetical protein